MNVVIFLHWLAVEKYCDTEGNKVKKTKSTKLHRMNLLKTVIKLANKTILEKLQIAVGLKNTSKSNSITVI